MKKLKVAEHLTDDEYRILLETYSDHNSSMNFADRKKYSADKIVKVERGVKCLIVHYEDGKSYLYTADRTWH